MIGKMTRVIVGVVCGILAFGIAGSKPIEYPGPMATCTLEDGSSPGQQFPCRWDARAQGNGTGNSFVLNSAP